MDMLVRRGFIEARAACAKRSSGVACPPIVLSSWLMAWLA